MVRKRAFHMIRSGRETTTKIPKKSLPWRAVLGAAPLSPLGFGAPIKSSSTSRSYRRKNL